MAVVHRKIPTVNEVFDKLDSIHADVQNKFHDQWNWIDAGFYVESLRVHYAELKAKLAALEWTPITEDNLPPAKGRWLGWHPSWGDHVVMCHYDSDGELCGEWCEELGEQSLPCNNPTHFKLLNPPQEPK